MRFAGVLSSVLALTAQVVTAALPAGVCYSPFHSQDYYMQPSKIQSLLTRDLKEIAQSFSYVRTYHSQFYGTNIIDAVQEAGLKVAIGIQMLSPSGEPYAYLDRDIAAAIEAAKTAPESVIAIYAGNENLINGDWGHTSADTIIDVINRVKSELRGTKGANVPVGTVQRLNEWLSAPDAARLAAACDVIGANIYPFFTKGGEKDMKGTLNTQWKQFTSKYGNKARLTETGWPTAGSPSAQGNKPSVSNAQDYFNSFIEWTAEAATQAPFYFMMYDVSDAPGDDFEQHFGLAQDLGNLKIKVASTLSNIVSDLRDTFSILSSNDVPTETVVATDAPAPSTETPAPSSETPVPTSVTPAVASSAGSADTAVIIEPKPVAGSSSSGSSSGEDILTFDGKTFNTIEEMEEYIRRKYSSSSEGSTANAGSASESEDVSVGDSDDVGMAPAPTKKKVVITPAPAPVTTAPAGSGSVAEQEAAAREASSRVARDVSGKTDGAFYTMTAFMGFAGCAAMAIIAVYVKRRKAEGAEEEETQTVATSIDPRGSTPSVYDDPLGTRFSSIVMITPNGDGVCVL
ncbi:hypothetical protein Poli38472_013758 [Pythium oligandrum]|uniref:glucan endo-1,3-beta-D-glucosidase n=1 Tax=Pythium oligandrum TaxID=41045 RepID=A0A8K1CEF5_PYTOL|nr:hypothetical protein Poli38472_013758 [Pythium oligandrum]|eukprot:TMW61295.1 hypothetical protein Poli38472_013758 [Pythium oligandrum]